MGTVVNFGSLIILSIALLRIKRWIKSEYIGLRTWRCTVEGLFVIYLILFLSLFAIELAMTVEIYKIDR